MPDAHLHVDADRVKAAVHDGHPAVFRSQYEQRHQRLHNDRQRPTITTHNSTSTTADFNAQVNLG